MKALLTAAGHSFLRAWLAAILILAPGVLAAPNLNRAVALGEAALIAAIAAGLKALQTFVPQLSFAALVKQPWAAWADSFARAFLAALLTSLYGILNMPDMAFWKSAAVGALVGAVTAGLRAVQGALTPGEAPFRASGVPPPPAPPPAPVG